MGSAYRIGYGRRGRRHFRSDAHGHWQDTAMVGVPCVAAIVRHGFHYGVRHQVEQSMAGAVAGDVHADRGRANHPVSCQRCAERLGRSRVFELGHHHAHYDFVGHRIDHSPATMVCAAIGGTVDRHAARQYRVRFGGWVEPVLRKHEGTP